jgi:hypothetical protein
LFDFQENQASRLNGATANRGVSRDGDHGVVNETPA